MKGNYLIIFLVLFISGKGFTQRIDTDDYSTYKSLLKSVEVDGGRLAYLDVGLGDEVILMVHGVPTNSWLYAKIINQLPLDSIRVIAVDMLGYGQSDKPEGYDIYSHQKQAKRIVELMNHLDVEKWNHVCHDVGGLWTWELLKNHSDRVKSLTVLNTIMFSEGFNPPMRFKKNGWAKFYTWLYKTKWGSKMMIKATFKNGMKKGRSISKARLRGFWEPMQEGGNQPLFYFFSQTCLHMPNNDSLFSTLKMPIQLIWGEHDDILQLEPQKEQIKKVMSLKSEDIHIIDAKHFIQEEKAEVVANQLMTFCYI